MAVWASEDFAEVPNAYDLLVLSSKTKDDILFCPQDTTAYAPANVPAQPRLATAAPGSLARYTVVVTKVINFETKPSDYKFTIQVRDVGDGSSFVLSLLSLVYGPLFRN